MDVVVADPPRAGLGRAGVRAVAATRAGRVALVSCDAGALGRDTRLLRGAGYDLVSSTVVDVFPHTPHVEVVSRFDRRSGRDRRR
jgi:tRNA/tmRNA/rRNA uracil-C5-methylase (TrmA/RlmC/RlmD family)